MPELGLLQPLRHELRTVTWPGSLSRDSGELILVDDFEATLLKWGNSTYTGGAGGGVTRSTIKAYGGDAALKIASGVTVGGGYQAFRQFFLPHGAVPRVGLEVWFAIPLGNYNIRFGLAYFDGNGHVYDALVLYTLADLRWHYHTGLDIFADIPSAIQSLLAYNDHGEPTIHEFAFHHLKLVIDFENMLYRNLISDDQSYDLTALPIMRENSTWKKHYRAQFGFYNRAGVAVSADAFLDDVIITSDEG
jgi:hypothetical protein